MSARLIDTNVALFALGAPNRLTEAARTAILAGSNVLSVVSYWEVVLKSSKGALKLDDPQQWWKDALERLAATSLPLRAEHISVLHSLPMHHKDPFDRVLIAQAKAEGLSFITSDREILRYASKDFKVIR